MLQVGQPFYDPDADAVLFEAIEESMYQTDMRKVIRLPYHINDPEFAQALFQNFKEVAK